MDQQEPQFLEVGQGPKRRRLAYALADSGPGGSGLALLWLPGFLSDMVSTKALALADWAEARGHSMLRFDYSGHGLSPGNLLEASIGDWLEEATSMLGLLKGKRVIVIGSSMGGWIALLLARALAKSGGVPLAALVLIAPAWDMTEKLMWEKMSEKTRRLVETEGLYYAPSLYGDPYPITKHLIDEGRKHLVVGGGIEVGAPVRILQGMRDPDVPWQHALALVDLLASDDVQLTLVKDGDHRLSEPGDLRRLEATVAALVERVQDST
ncbi:MAG: alpha/beta hydrolase [Methyloceanibacter sp.]|uniref:alpha/beta hydrolase n=1 Tax=Methyloceanibacter sp. TaxID=1965321 RepID=UPI003D6C729C